MTTGAEPGRGVLRGGAECGRRVLGGATDALRGVLGQRPEPARGVLRGEAEPAGDVGRRVRQRRGLGGDGGRGQPGRATPAPPQGRAAFGVRGGDHQTTEQAEVLEEVDLLLSPPLLVLLLPEAVAGQRGRHQRGGQRGRGQPGGLVQRQQRPGHDLHRGIDLDQHLVVGTVVDGRHLDHLVDHRRGGVEHRPSRLDATLRCAQRTDPTGDEDGRQHRPGNSSKQHGVDFPPSRARTNLGTPVARRAIGPAQYGGIRVTRPRSGAAPRRRDHGIGVGPDRRAGHRPGSRRRDPHVRGLRPPLRAGPGDRPGARRPHPLPGARRRRAGLAAQDHAVPGERDPHPRTDDRRREQDHLRLVPLPEGGRSPARRRPGHRRAGRVRGPDVPAAAGRVAGRVAAARRPGLRRRADRGEPAPDRRPPGPAPGVAGRRDRELRGVRRAVPGLVDRSRGPLAALLRTHRDDLRRPRRPGRLEHLRDLAGADPREAVVARPDPVGDRLLLGLPAPGQPLPRRARRRPGLHQDRRARRGRVAVAGRAGRPRRRRGRRRQGGAVQLPLGPRATAAS